MTATQAVIKRYRQIKTEKHLTNHKVCENAGISRATLDNILYKGLSVNAGINTIFNVCYGLGVTVREFFDDDIFNDISYK